MKRSDLKQILKPLIKECIKEVLFEDGVLSGVISEVIKGTGNTQVVAAPAPTPVQAEKINEQREHQRLNKLKETRKKMLDAIGNNSFNGVDLFEGTAPMSSAGSAAPQPQSPLSNYAPDDSGIDISGIMNVAAGKWKNLV